MSFLKRLFGSGEKRFRIPGDQIKRVIPPMGGCLATDHILVDGKKVGYMYREAPKFESDSGWRFFSGKESPAYIDDSKHTGIYEVNTIANYDSDIIPYLDAEAGTAFARIDGTQRFEKEAFSPPHERPNQPPEPTITLVMLRASSFAQPTEDKNARVAPAPIVAHL